MTNQPASNFNTSTKPVLLLQKEKYNGGSWSPMRILWGFGLDPLVTEINIIRRHFVAPHHLYLAQTAS